jgi:hypothetical protein
MGDLPPDPGRDALEREADRIEEDCTYSAKGHFESARIWGRWNLWVGIPAAVLGAFAGVSGFSDLPELAGGLAVFSGALAALLTVLKPSERASSHQKAGALYNSVKNRARFFREVDLTSGARPAVLRKRLRQLAEERNALSEASPEILRPAFEKARKGIESGEATYRADSSRPR